MAIEKCTRKGRAGKFFRVRVGKRTKWLRIEEGKHDETRKAAKDLEHQWEHEEKSGKTRARVPTFAEFVGTGAADGSGDGEFMRYQAAVRGNKPDTLEEKRCHFRNHLLDFFGATRLDKIDANLLDAYKETKKGRLADNTIKNHLITTRRVLSVARRKGYREAEVPTVEKTTIREKEREHLTAEEVPVFLAAADPEWRLFMLTAIRAGLRLGELRGLKWRRVRVWTDAGGVSRGRIVVAETFGKHGWGTPKSEKSKREVPVASDLVEALAAARPRKVGREDLVFVAPSGGPVDEKAAYNACVRAAERAGLEKRITPHGLRHTFGFGHAMGTTPPRVLQQWMGHESLTTTMRYMGKAEDEADRHIDNPLQNSGSKSGSKKREAA